MNKKLWRWQIMYNIININRGKSEAILVYVNIITK
jgi:hypothetical protein